LTPPVLVLPPEVELEASGVARIGEVRVKQLNNDQSDDCKLVFSVVWIGPSSAELPQVPTFEVNFENTARQAEAVRREREAQAAREEERSRLQAQHNVDLKEAKNVEGQRRLLQQALKEQETTSMKMVEKVMQQLGTALQVPAHEGPPSESLDHALVQLQHAHRNATAANFRARISLTTQDNAIIADVARQRSGFAETVSTIFEFHSGGIAFTPEQFKSLAALLADDVGKDAMTMVVTGDTATAQAVRDRTKLRVFALDNAIARDLRESPINATNFDGWICPAWKLLQVRDDLAHWAEELMRKVLPCVGLGNLVLVANEQAALAYQRRFKELVQSRQLPMHASMPSILGLDGFKLSSAGWFGGRKGKMTTSLDRLPPHMSHFAFQGSRVHNLESIVTSLSEQLGQLRCREAEINKLGSAKAAIEGRLQLREQEATGRGMQLLTSLVATRPIAPTAAASGHIATRHSATSRSAEEAGLQGRQEGVRRTRYG